MDGKAYCEKHYVQPKKARPFSSAGRSNSALYATARWRALRKSHIDEYPFCAMCGSKSGLTVDHIVPPRGNEELFFCPGNLQTLCKPCHRIKTAIEIRERRKGK